MSLVRLLRHSLLVVAPCIAAFTGHVPHTGNSDKQKLPIKDTPQIEKGFINPPPSARPGVYWYFMDGNLTKEAMTKDLESMKDAGLGNALFLEVNVGVPRGKVDFYSAQWQDIFKYMNGEAKRLGIEIALGTGPGWTGSGGPWVKPEQSMQHLVSSTINVTGPASHVSLPLPLPKKPYFGEQTLIPDLKKKWNDFYKDVAVIAFPSPSAEYTIDDIDEKALYYRPPYTSAKNVKPFIPSLAKYAAAPIGAVINKSKLIDLTGKLQPDGTLNWNVPPGKWTIMRFVSRNNGAVTRPAPLPGLGFEADKFDTTAMNAHLDIYPGQLLAKLGKVDKNTYGGLKRLHIDSWEMGAQNWTPHFRQEFIKRRGYDPLPFYPVYAGKVIGSVETSERFLWDLRLTSKELIIENHAEHIKRYSHNHGLSLSIEPYDLNPSADLELGAVADIPMGEFWSKGFGFVSSFSCIEAASIAHINGISLVPAESFTAAAEEGWKQHPASMKNQGDWAFAAGINRFVFHTFQSQVLDDDLKPGMTMGPYGVHWDRNQTWWPMVSSYHKYVSRCSYVLQQGRTIADILYLTPEGAPQVFRAPASAFDGDDVLPDRKGYNFDGCAPGQLYHAMVKNNRIVFPSGASYRVLVLPLVKTMTPRLLQKIAELVKDGATIIGEPPLRSPGLSGYPACDAQVKTLVQKLWGNKTIPKVARVINFGKGQIIWGGDVTANPGEGIYPSYKSTAKRLAMLNIPEDFKTTGEVRYTHRASNGWDIYFVSNRTDQDLDATCTFRAEKGTPELWNAVTGSARLLPDFKIRDHQTSLPLKFAPYESYFIVFKNNPVKPAGGAQNFPVINKVDELKGAWSVAFDPKWGGPATVQFDALTDWTKRPEEGIKYYSGTATYKKSFHFDRSRANQPSQYYLDLGIVKNMARVHLNGEDLGVIWTSPWRTNITKALKNGENKLEIEVVNLWPNRLIGDERLPDDGIKNQQWPEWVLNHQKRPSGRYTFATYRHYHADSPLLSSGLLGPVTILSSK